MPTLQELLEQSRKELLDLSTRNRLLSIPVNSKSARIIQVHDERSEQVFRLLVSDHKSFSFLPTRSENALKQEPDTEEIAPPLRDLSLPQPEESEDPISGLPKRHIDLRLQTNLTSESLQRRLLELFRDAQTMIEEQGVNILYLALGQLKWLEAEKGDARFAPLILVPVQLHRKSASERFHLRWREEDIQENISLQAKLKADFGIDFPRFSYDEDDDDKESCLSAYFDAVRNVIAGAKEWEVLPDSIVLGFFSFAKFLMYRDLDPQNWPQPDKLLKHPLIAGVLLDGFPHSESSFLDDVHLDELIPASRLDHVVDGDSSQTRAIEMVRQGRCLVIQGPPGTGKSQSITNIIATAVLDKKTVLFVAEKLAALEVVKRRLEREGLGSLCLELHSNKSSKRAVIDEIGRTWQLGRPLSKELEAIIPKLERVRAVLNAHAESLHEKLAPYGLTAFNVIGRLAVLGERGREVADLQFRGAEAWTLEEHLERRKLIQELSDRVQRVGCPSNHPWRGVCRETVLNIDLPSIEARIRVAMEALSELRNASLELAKRILFPQANSFAEAHRQVLIGKYMAEAPLVDKSALCDGVWNAGFEGLRNLLEEGRRFSKAVSRAKEEVTQGTWDEDFSEVRMTIARHGASIFRILRKDYRVSITKLRDALTVPLPKAYSERLALLDILLAGQRALRAIRDANALGESGFGSLWRGEKSDWNQLAAVLDWVARQRDAGLNAEFREVFAKVKDQVAIEPVVANMSARLSTAKQAVEALCECLCLDWKIAFGVEGVDHAFLDTVHDRCSAWLVSLEQLTQWNNYFLRSRHAKQMNLDHFVEKVESGSLSPAAMIDGFDRIYYGQILRDIAKRKPELAQFDGTIHDNHIEEFKQLDKDRLSLAKLRVLLAQHERMPPSSGVGPAGIVKGEVVRRRGHRTVRRLLKDAGSIVQAIKPVFMMSPLSVAQFLEPGAVEFDLLVIDEASQVQPVDALGAIARSKQVVVVGDSKQLPPTRFFSRLTTSDDGEDEEESSQIAAAQDVESILGLCCARGLPQTMLRWHYRSRHHSLIAVSNREFYEDQLFIVPSPYTEISGLGLKFHHVADGIFDAGGTGTNRTEAKAVCRAVLEHARNTPELSLGVAAFSIRQRQVIQDELELLRRDNPDIEAFFVDHLTEPFFVKNLENVQGDERDVVFISVGYGPNAQGYMAMRFGPLSNEGGERRLNVLISRAKQRCDIFSSITADDIDLVRASGKGVAALKSFLNFAENGRLGIARQSGLEEQSPFEEAVRRQVESLGYEVHCQVGIAGFFVDLAVLDPDRSGRYVIGIECDGAAYHSSRSARDRDRLRQAVLEDHGWIIHRIWSTDWFQRPASELRKVSEAIKRAKGTAVESPTHDVRRDLSYDYKVERESNPREVDFRSLARPYEQAEITVPTDRDPHDLSTKEMAEVVFAIIEKEGPIHEEELIIRVRDLWGVGRAGSRISDSVKKGIRSLLKGTRCKKDGGFVQTYGADIRPRNRENVSSLSLRKPNMLPPSEIKAAILALIDSHHGATIEELPVAVARIFGYRTTSAQLREVIQSQEQSLLEEGVLEELNGMLKRSGGNT